MKIKVQVKPNSKHRQEVVESDGVFVVYVKSPAIEGKANLAAIQELAKFFKVSKSRVSLIKGESSKFKTFEIDY